MRRDRATPFFRAVATALIAFSACRDAARAPEAEPSPPPPGATRGPFALTYYWIAVESDGARDTTLFETDCEPAAKVTAAFARELELAGTGRLADGRVVGVEGKCSCARSPCVELARRDAPWGVGATGRPLAAFRSLAVDPEVIPLGTPLYIEELDGAPLPGLAFFPHDGCVVADDRGDRIEAARVDWFVGGEHAFRLLEPLLHLDTVTVHDGGARCARLAR